MTRCHFTIARTIFRSRLTSASAEGVLSGTIVTRTGFTLLGHEPLTHRARVFAIVGRPHGSSQIRRSVADTVSAHARTGFGFRAVTWRRPRGAGSRGT